MEDVLVLEYGELTDTGRRIVERGEQASTFFLNAAARMEVDRMKPRKVFVRKEDGETQELKIH